MNCRAFPRARRHFIAPEVVQTSSMDCGPASLKCLLEGFGISVSYPRLQEACQTDLDGTSINVIEQIAVRLGLEAEQIMIPVDHLLLRAARALPALLVTRQANNMLHFLVAWRRHGQVVQVMDPAKGRRWLRARNLNDEIFVHGQTVSARAWREWAASAEFLDSLGERLERLRFSHQLCERLATDAAADPGWRGLATLDAATRMVTAIVRASGLRAGQDAARVLRTLVERAQHSSAPIERLIPPSYWSVQPVPSNVEGPAPGNVEGPDSSPPDDSQICFRGAVLVRVRQRTIAAREQDEPAVAEKLTELSLDLVTALKEPPFRPVREVTARVRADGVLAPAVLVWATVLGAGAVLMELALFRGFLEIGLVLGVTEQRLGSMIILLAFAAALLLLDLAVGGGVLRVGRRLESRLRIALLEKLPRLGERYFHSRLVSDMAQRAHSLPMLRALPSLGARLIRSSVQLVLTAVALAWIDPPSALVVAFAAAFALAIPLATQRMLGERELRKRTHSAAMTGFYLDSLLGLVTARTHGAERSIRRGHETRVVEWARAGLHLLRGGLVIDGLQSLAGFCLAAWLVLGYIERGGSPGGTLLFIYWAMSLPALGRELAASLQQYPAQRNVLARLLEPLGAPNETEETRSVRPAVGPREIPSGVAITLERVDVRTAGHEILHDINLTIRPREHIAVVGRSGAGKSSLAGILLGWYRPSSGEVLVDGVSLKGNTLASLRRQTAWIDPAIQLWNRSLFDNLRYGHPDGPTLHLSQVVETAELEEVLEGLPDGLQSLLGEGGALTSGGEGQRVRFGRALGRRHARLVIMDEPFRGLDRQQRHELLARARTFWRDATLICVTHDISETQAFDRVLVIEGGRLVEDGNPIDLAKRAGSAYARLLEAEQAVSALWSAPGWRRLRLDDGSLVEDSIHEVSRWTVHQGSRGL
jgi:ABC-type bacteriocin/lantibiotic exporter with double-glycine peptidase domain